MRLSVTRFIIVVSAYLIASMAVANPVRDGDHRLLNRLTQYDDVPGTYEVAINDDLAGKKSTQKMELSFSVAGHRYNYLLYTPKSYQADQPYPLLIVAQGFRSRSQRFMHSTGMDELAERYGFLIAFLSIEDEESWASVLSVENNSNSAAFIRALMVDIAAQRNIQSNRIYLTGFSLGGMLILGAMCELSDTVAGFAVVSATFPRQLVKGCVPRKSIPAIIIASRDDPVIPWDGGLMANDFGKSSKLQLLSVVETADIWIRNNGCNDRPLIEPLANVDATDGTTVTRMAYDFNCNGNAVVLIYAITGGGHSWPGSRYKLHSFEGAISRDIDASSVIWNFFNESNNK